MRERAKAQEDYYGSLEAFTVEQPEMEERRDKETLAMNERRAAREHSSV